jgi:carbon storage regulator
MLVLSRGKDETVVLGDEHTVLGSPIRVTVIDIRGDKVRLGIDADKGLPVHREEVWDAIQNAKEKPCG